MTPRLPHHHFQQFLEDFFRSPTEQLGKQFMAMYFPGVEDPDVSEEVVHGIVIPLIQDRYVQPLNA